MKVRLASLSYRPSVGGLVTYLDSFSRWLRLNGHEPLIICANDVRSSLPATEELDGVLVIRVPALRRGLLGIAFRPVLTSRCFSKWFGEYDQPDTIIVARHVYVAAALALVPRLREQTLYLMPLVASRLAALNMRSESPLRRMRTRFLLSQLYLIEAWTLARLPHVAVLSKSKRNEVLRTFRRRKPIHVIPPGVDLDRFRPPADRAERDAIRSKIGLVEDRVDHVIVTVGRLVVEKNIETLIRAIAELESDRVSLVVVGDGPLRADLERCSEAIGVSERVLFLGNRDDVEVVLRAADVFVLPSTYEGFGHVLLEALATGVPVLGLRADPPAVVTATEEVIHNEVGAVVGENTATCFAHTIEAVLSRGQVNLAERCRSHAESQFSWGRHLELIAEIMRE